jgi:hypothetical protein
LGVNIIHLSIGIIWDDGGAAAGAGVKGQLVFDQRVSPEIPYRLVEQIKNDERKNNYGN